jgi:hypothetical protein
LLRRAKRSAAKITPSRKTSRIEGSLTRKKIAWSMIPSATADTKVARRFSIRPTTAGARARTSNDGPNAPPAIDRPIVGARSSAPTAESPAAKIHTIVEMRRTGTPRSEARSWFSAAARDAIPTRLNFRNSVIATIRTGTTVIARTWFALKITGGRLPATSGTANSASNGVGMSTTRKSSPNTRGRISSTNTSTCVTAIVATVSTSRGALKKRLTTVSSIRAPNNSDVVIPIAIATK